MARLNLFARLSGVLVIGALLNGGTLPQEAKAAPPTATVVGTDVLQIRSCPETSCDIVATAPLGASLTLGEKGGTPEPGDAAAAAADATAAFAATGRFLPVAYQGEAGYVPDLYLAVEPAHVPYLLQGEEGCKRVALIFNVGVGEKPARGILDTLKAEQVAATMFIMGWWADAHPAILRRMVDDGYPIGSHGYAPIELTERSDDAVAHDIQQAAEAIEHATGKQPARLFTPYAAAMDERVRAIVATAGYLPIGWTVPAADYGATATEWSVYERVMGSIHDGGIVELHLDGPASAESTGRALPRIVSELRSQGYRFVTIPEMTQPCPSRSDTAPPPSPS